MSTELATWLAQRAAIDAANKVRRSKGMKDIELKNKSVIPPKNMDFDD